MDSRAGDSRIGTNVRTYGETTLNDSELDSDSTIYSEATPTMNRSIESSVNASLITKKYANYRRLDTDDNDDICSYKTWRNKISTSNSLIESKSSSILAGNVGITSRDSSDSYHSAQSTLMSTEEATTNLNIALTESKQRDTNYNFDSTTESESEASISTLNSTSDETSHFMLPFLERLSKELNIFPQDNQEKKLHLKRLSGHFAENPEEFKNKLVTIIEESEMTNHQSQMERSCEKSNLMSEQLRKICKYIMDESMPVGLMVSPTGGINDQTATNHVHKNMRETPKNIDKEKPEVIDLCTPPSRPVKKVYRKTPKFIVHAQKMSQSPLCIATLKKNNETPRTPGNKTITPVNKSSPRSPLDKSEFLDSFTYWERYCEKHATPVSESRRTRRSCSVPDIIYLIKSNEIKRNADIQLRKLETSDDENFVAQESFESFESPESSTDEESQLEQSVLEEVALKRQLCYETERISLNSSDDNDEHVLEHLTSFVDRCGEYQQCLKKNRTTLHKTLGNIARESPKKILETKGSGGYSLSKNSKNQRLLSRVPPVSNISKAPLRKPLLNRSKSCLSVNSKSSGQCLQVPLVTSTASTPMKRTPSKADRNSQKIHERTSKFFPTPGSSCRKPFLRSKPSKYFESPQSVEKTSITLKPRKVFTGMEYFGYSNVKSPVAQYIKSTDSKLVQNVKGKIEESLLTPRNGGDKRSNAVEALRVPLSRQHQRKEDNTENIPINSPVRSFPKVVYKSASRVRDIRLSPSKVYGEREKVLREVNNKMIIQHASRHYDGVAEESIRVSKQAAKTNCLGSPNPTTTSRKPWK